MCVGRITTPGWARRLGDGSREFKRFAHARRFLRASRARARQTHIMLKTQLLHPDILRICAQAGHHAKILIADGNYPASTKRGPNAELVCLNLSPGCVTVAQVLRAVLSAVPVDFVNTMGIPADDAYAKFGEPPAWAEFRAIANEAGVAGTIQPISKWDFYKHVESPDHVLTIQTGDQALWANVLLTLGCRTS
jgi:L-fucose mutarotase